MAKIHGIVAVDGPVGVGKSFAVDLAAKDVGQPVFWLDMPDRPKGKETTARILQLLTGRHTNVRLPEYALLNDVLDLLAGRSCLLIVDEAQNLNQSSLRQIRYLHEQPESCFTLVLVGFGVRQVLELHTPELADRVRRWVQGRPIPLEAVGKAVRAYHPIFAATEPAVIDRLYQSAGGTLRHGGLILEAALAFGLRAERGIPDSAVPDILLAIGRPTVRRRAS